MSKYNIEVGLNWTTTYYNQQNKKPIFSITPDGRFIPGEGLSDDEATQRLAEVMSSSFQSQIRKSVNRDMADEIERLREALRDCHHVLHKLMAIVPGNDMAVDEMTKVMAKARAALEEGK